MRKFSLIAAAVAMTAGSLTADIQIGKGLTVGGFLDMTYSNTDTDNTGAAAAVADKSGFSVATAEIDFGMDFGNGLTATIDLEGNVGSDSSTTNPRTSAVEVEQARIDYSFGQSTLTLGKFDTFIGLEGLEAPDLYQFSNSLTFALEPTQHEGISYAYNGGMWNVAAAIVNGITSDNGNTTVGATGTGDSTELAYAIHLGVTPVDSLSFNLNYAMGDNELDAVAPATAGADSDVTLWTIDASYSNHGWTVGAEYVSSETDTVTAATTTTVDTKAWMLMANYMFTEQFGLTARYSKSEEETVGADVEGKEWTLAASYAMTPNWSALVEYRSEEFDAGHTASGALAAGAGQEADIITLETILTF